MTNRPPGIDIISGQPGQSLNELPGAGFGEGWAAVLAAPAVNSDATPQAPNRSNAGAQLTAIATSIFKCLCMGTFRGCAETLSGYIDGVHE
jgi:hypothetical protein